MYLNNHSSYTKCFLCLIGFYLACSFLNARTVELTTEELAYLQQLGTIKYAIDPDWEPYERLNEQGKHEGIAAAALALIAERLGLQLELVPTKDWDESIKISKEGKVHFLAFLNRTPKREEWLSFTEPYFRDPNVIVTRVENDYISDLSAIENATVVIPSGTSIGERIARDFPSLKIILAPSGTELECLKMVETGQANLTLRSLSVVAYTIRKNGIFNLKIAGEVTQYANEFRIGVIKSDPMLRDIFNKGIKTLTPSEIRRIVNDHIAIKVEKPFDYTFVLKIAGILFALMLVGTLWSLQLRKLNKQLSENEKSLRLLNEQLKIDNQARLEAERSKAVFISNLPGISYRCLNDENWTMTFISDGCRELTGYSADDFTLNKKIAYNDVIAVPFRDKVRNVWEQAIKERKRATFEYAITTTDHTEKWVLEQGVAIYRPDGSVEALEGLIIDITERKKAEQKNIHAASVFANSDTAITITDANATIIDVNPSFTRITGYTREEAIGKNPRVLKSDRQDAAFYEKMWDEITKNGYWRGEIWNKRKYGEVYPELLAISAVRDESGRLLNYIALFHDISLFKTREAELRHANEVKSQLMGMAAHDLKNPLCIVRDMAEILLSDVQTAGGNGKDAHSEQANMYKDIYKTADHALAIIDGLLNMEQIESGTIAIHLEPTPIQDVIAEIININTLNAQKKKITIHNRITEDCVVMMDIQRMQEVFDNLISNAVKYSPQGKNVFVESEFTHDGFFKIKVRDEGPGLTDKDKEKVFGKFQKLSARPTAGESSSGFGLSIVKKLVELHNGRIGVESIYGQGATFFVELPTETR